MSQHVNILDMAREQLAVAAKYLDLDEGLHAVLAQPGIGQCGAHRSNCRRAVRL